MKMGTYGSSRRSRDGFVSALSAGFFFVLVGVLFIVTPNLFDSIVRFFQNFDMVQVPHFTTGFVLPAPKNPAMHVTVYSAATQFGLAWGLFLIGLLAVRILANSPLRKKAENASDIVYWLVNSYLVTIFLNSTTTIPQWFAFWAAIIMLAGITLLIRAAILAVIQMVS
ncbi:MAG TPA: hypothetical protein VMS94_01370 [Acidobacteriota bacterium]|nr:hypothetical protein [Acidobacteriota bacterium]